MPRQIEIHYLTAGGSYRKGLGTPDGVLLRNERDSQLHALRHSTVVVKSDCSPPMVDAGWRKTGCRFRGESTL